jgi:hypothetical protein
LGEATRWLVEPTGGAASLAGPCFDQAGSEVRLRWQQTDLAGALRLEGASGGALAFGPKPPDPYRRLQILTGHANLLDLLQNTRLGGVVAVRDPDTRTELARAQAGDDLPCSPAADAGGAPGLLLSKQLLQCWLSNLDLVRRLVAQWNRLRPHRPLALTAGTPWQVVGTWAREQAGGFTVLDGPARVVGLASVGTDLAEPVLCCHQELTFDAAAWQQECDGPLPHWLQRPGGGGLVGCREDVLQPALGGTERLEWTVELHVSRGAWPTTPAQAPAGPVLVRGQVKEWVRGFGLKIDLDDADPAAREVHCLPLAPSTGKTHNAGAHVLPYPGTVVLVAMAAGLGGGPAVCLGAVRHQESVTTAPSIEFEDKLRLLSQQAIELKETSGSGGELVVKGGKVTVSGT